MAVLEFIMSILYNESMQILWLKLDPRFHSKFGHHSY